VPPGDPGSRFERFGADPVVDRGVVYAGTHDGHVLALDAADGRVRWDAVLGDAVCAAPAIAGGRVLVGSFDHAVYALDAGNGHVQWKRDTGFAVVSTPAVADGRVVIGTRGNDLFGLDLATGAVRWRRYVWMSWVESSARIRDGIAYVGTSDAAWVGAFAVRDGAPRWRADVQGWAWGQPEVGARRVYVTTSGRNDSPVPFRPGVMALDRASGAVVWRYADPIALVGDDGFPGSPALGGGMVFASSYDGRVLGFAE